MEFKSVPSIEQGLLFTLEPCIFFFAKLEITKETLRGKILCAQSTDITISPEIISKAPTR